MDQRRASLPLPAEGCVDLGQRDPRRAVAVKVASRQAGVVTKLSSPTVLRIDAGEPTAGPRVGLLRRGAIGGRRLGQLALQLRLA